MRSAVIAAWSVFDGTVVLRKSLITAVIMRSCTFFLLSHVLFLLAYTWYLVPVRTRFVPGLRQLHKEHVKRWSSLSTSGSSPQYCE